MYSIKYFYEIKVKLKMIIIRYEFCSKHLLTFFSFLITTTINNIKYKYLTLLIFLNYFKNYYYNNVFS